MDRFFHLNSVGLLYDGTGIVALGFAFFMKSVKAMMVESGTYFGGNDALLESLIQQRTDGIAGTCFLSVGFVLQFLGSLAVRSTPTGEILTVLLVLMAVAYPIFIRPKTITMQRARGSVLREKHLAGKE